MKLSKKRVGCFLLSVLALGVAFGGCGKKDSKEKTIFDGNYKKTDAQALGEFCQNLNEGTDVHSLYVNNNNGLLAQGSMSGKKEGVPFTFSLDARANFAAMPHQLDLGYAYDGETALERGAMIFDGTYMYLDDGERKVKDEIALSKDMVVEYLDGNTHAYEEELVVTKYNETLAGVLATMEFIIEGTYKNLQSAIENIQDPEQKAKLEEELSQYNFEYYIDSTDVEYTKIQLEYSQLFSGAAVTGLKMYRTYVYTYVYTKENLLVAYKNDVELHTTTSKIVNGDVEDYEYRTAEFTYSATPWSGTITPPADADEYVEGSLE